MQERDMIMLIPKIDLAKSAEKDGYLQQTSIKIYSDSEIKKQYTNDAITGGMWDISERTSMGMWKATMILFGGLAVMVTIIIMFR